MPLGAIALALAVSAASTLPATGPSGFVRTDEGTVTLDGRRGAFFGTYRPGAAYARSTPPGSTGPAVMETSTSRAGGEPQRPPPDPCRAERSAYLKELLRMSGIELDDPLAFLDGLAGPAGYSSAFLYSPYGLIPTVDPVTPLAWNFQLRSLARDLSRCSTRAAR